MVPYPGNVSIPGFSYVWRYRVRACNRDDLCLADKKVPRKNDLWRIDTTLQNKIFKGAGIWRIVVRGWLGDNRSVSRPSFRPDRKRDDRHHCNFIKRCCRNLGIRLFQGQDSTLKTTG